eukprot:189896_1
MQQKWNHLSNTQRETILSARSDETLFGLIPLHCGFSKEELPVLKEYLVIFDGIESSDHEKKTNSPDPKPAKNKAKQKPKKLIPHHMAPKPPSFVFKTLKPLWPSHVKPPPKVIRKRKHIIDISRDFANASSKRNVVLELSNRLSIETAIVKIKQDYDNKSIKRQNGQANTQQIIDDLGAIAKGKSQGKQLKNAKQNLSYNIDLLSYDIIECKATLSKIRNNALASKKMAQKHVIETKIVIKRGSSLDPIQIRTSKGDLETKYKRSYDWWTGIIKELTQFISKTDKQLKTLKNVNFGDLSDLMKKKSMKSRHKAHESKQKRDAERKAQQRQKKKEKKRKLPGNFESGSPSKKQKTKHRNVSVEQNERKEDDIDNNNDDSDIEIMENSNKNRSRNTSKQEVD